MNVAPLVCCRCLAALVAACVLLCAPATAQLVAPGDSPLFAPPALGHEDNTSFPPAPSVESEPASQEGRPSWLPPMEEELARTTGAFMYEPEGEFFHHHHGAHLGQHGHTHANGQPHHRLFDRLHRQPWCAFEEEHSILRLPEDFQPPQPLTYFADYLGADPIQHYPGLAWLGPNAYQWEPRFVAAGQYTLFGFSFSDGTNHQEALGHQLFVDLDLRLTGTERFHVQFRPLGEDNTGGSFFQFNDPSGYVDNSTAAPSRFWFEGELNSIFSGWIDDKFLPLDYGVVVGKFAFIAQNQLLINDEVAGVVLNKNTIRFGNWSNANLQVFYLFDDVNAFPDAGAEVVGANLFVDSNLVFFEANYAYRTNSRFAGRDAHYFALAGTKLVGPWTLAARGLFKVGDSRGTGDGQLFVLESNYTRIFDNHLARALDIHHGVFYANAFHVSRGWETISGGNINRLTGAFEVNPLVQIGLGQLSDAQGVVLGAQLFRIHENESLTPELAWQNVQGSSVLGLGLRYQRKTSVRSFLDVQGVYNESDNPALDRRGIFAAHSWLF